MFPDQYHMVTQCPRPGRTQSADLYHMIEYAPGLRKSWSHRLVNHCPWPGKERENARWQFVHGTFAHEPCSFRTWSSSYYITSLVTLNIVHCTGPCSFYYRIVERSTLLCTLRYRAGDHVLPGIGLFATRLGTFSTGLRTMIYRALYYILPGHGPWFRSPWTMSYWAVDCILSGHQTWSTVLWTMSYWAVDHEIQGSGK